MLGHFVITTSASKFKRSTVDCELLVSKPHTLYILTVVGKPSGQTSYMDEELTENEKEIQEVDSLIDKLSGSAIEFRKSIYDIVFQRLSRFFRTKNKEITKDTRLKDIFNSNFTEADWEELRNIGLRIPGLQRAKLFEHLTLTYFIAAFVTLATLAIKNFELVFAVWGLPVLGIIITLTCSPLLLFMMVFKRRYLPCDTIDDLVESIISVNWTELLTDDKSLFKELVREEEDYRRRASAQQCI